MLYARAHVVLESVCHPAAQSRLSHFTYKVVVAGATQSTRTFRDALAVVCNNRNTNRARQVSASVSPIRTLECSHAHTHTHTRAHKPSLTCSRSRASLAARTKPRSPRRAPSGALPRDYASSTIRFVSLVDQKCSTVQHEKHARARCSDGAACHTEAHYTHTHNARAHTIRTERRTNAQPHCTRKNAPRQRLRSSVVRSLTRACAERKHTVIILTHRAVHTHTPPRDRA